jgi:hypothetical protein
MARHVLNNWLSSLSPLSTTRAPFADTHRIARAWLTSSTTGIIEMGADWTAASLPLLAPGDKAFSFTDLSPAEPSRYAEEAGYYVDDIGQAVFLLDPADYSWVDFSVMPVYVAGEFNGWQAAVGTLGQLRTIGHALRAWPTPLGVAINSATATWGPDGSIEDQSVIGQIDCLAAQLLDLPADSV